MKDTVEKFKGILEGNGSKVVNSENWGLKKLAYPIQHKSTGFYHLIEFDAEPQIVNALETEYRRDEAIMRFLTTALDKHAVVYNERRRKGAFRKEKKEEAKS